MSMSKVDFEGMITGFDVLSTSLKVLNMQLEIMNDTQKRTEKLLENIRDDLRPFVTEQTTPPISARGTKDEGSK